MSKRRREKVIIIIIIIITIIIIIIIINIINIQRREKHGLPFRTLPSFIMIAPRALKMRLLLFLLLPPPCIMCVYIQGKGRLFY